MSKKRQVIAYGNHFEDFLNSVDQKVQNKVFKIIEAIESLDRIPSSYIKHLTGTDGLYEARIKLGSNIWRVFCFFDGNRFVILLNGFQKKSQKTPKQQINRALRLMKEYYNEKQSQ